MADTTAREEAFIFDDWERSKLRIYVSGNAADYLAHYHGAGLFRGEIETMNRWRRLAAKLAGESYKGDLPYRGTRRNGFNPEAD